MLVTEKSSNFTRGDKASASVRLRSNKKQTSEAVKKKNRHSGDFSFFKHHNNNQNNTTAVDQEDGGRVGAGGDIKKEGGDWAYITFQNGVPTVQDIKTNVGPVSAKEVVGGVAVVNGATPVPRPVKVVNHQVRQNKRISGDFSMFSPPMMQVASSRQVTPAAAAYKQQANRGRGPIKTNVTQVMVPPPQQLPPQQHQPQQRPNVIYRRKNDQNSNGGVALHGGVAKRCSGEFDFARNNRRSASDYGLLLETSREEYMRMGHDATPPSVVRVQVNYNQNNVRVRPKSMAIPSGSPDVVRHTPMKEKQGPLMTPKSDPNPQPRPVGLGRRAVTQINIKKNSYNSAMCKSQENLVKVGLIFIYFFPNLFELSTTL